MGIEAFIPKSCCASKVETSNKQSGDDNHYLIHAWTLWADLSIIGLGFGRNDFKTVHEMNTICYTVFMPRTFG